MTVDETERRAICAERTYLLKFATYRLRDPELAQDAVQDTLLAALESYRTYAGRSAYRTWLVGILKHKMIDLTRRLAREAPAGVPEDPEMETPTRPGDPAHTYAAPRPAAGDPCDTLDRRRFWNAVASGLGALSPKGARALVMRDIDGFDTAEICQALGVSASNCGVILHRSRALMRNHLGALGYFPERVTSISPPRNDSPSPDAW